MKTFVVLMFIPADFITFPPRFFNSLGTLLTADFFILSFLSSHTWIKTLLLIVRAVNIHHPLIRLHMHIQGILKLSMINDWSLRVLVYIQYYESFIFFISTSASYCISTTMSVFGYSIPDGKSSDGSFGSLSYFEVIF